MPDRTPDEDVLCVCDATALVRAAAVEVDESELAGRREGEEGAVLAAEEGLGVFGVEGEPVPGGVVAVASAVVEQCSGRD